MSGTSVLILVYHSINEQAEKRIRIPNLVSPANFDDQMRYLAATATVISLSDCLARFRERLLFPRNAVVITFDDGYKDNLICAYPILEKYGFPATFFLATDYIGTGRLKWEDELTCLVRRSDAPSLTLGQTTYPLGDKTFKTINQLVRYLGRRDRAERQRMIDDLKRQLGAACDDTEGIMLSWDEARALAALPGVEIGAHTVTHPFLTRIPTSDVAQELTQSKAQIEAQLNQAVTSLAYPYGRFNDQTVAAAQAAGFASALCVGYGRNRLDTDLFRLKRIAPRDQRGLRFRFGLQLRASLFGETLRQIYDWLA